MTMSLEHGKLFSSFIRPLQHRQFSNVVVCSVDSRKIAPGGTTLFSWENIDTENSLRKEQCTND